MSDVSEIVRKSLDRAKAEERWEREQYEKSLRTPKWNHEREAWTKPLEALGGFGEKPARGGKPAPEPRQPHCFDESIAEFDDSGACFIRALPDSEEIAAKELYDFREADRFRYAKAARDTFNSVCESETGRCGNPERLNAQWSETAVLKSQSHEIAARIERASRAEADFHGDESLFVPMYRETNYGIYSYYLFSKVRTQAPKFRNSCFLPFMASQTRGKMLKALEYFLERNPFARMWTFTSGKRVGLDGIRKRVKQLHRRLSKLNKFLKTLGIELVFRATEFGTPEDGSDKEGFFERGENDEVLFHVHAHCLVRLIDDKPMSKERWAETLAKVWEFWGHHWDDGKSVQNIRELCKYVSKPGALLGLQDWELLKLYRETNSLHLVQPMGELRDQIRRRKDPQRRLRLEYKDTPDGKVLVEVDDWNCNREGEKDDDWKAREREERALKKLERLYHETEAEPEIRILAKCVPGYAPGSLIKEPRIVVMATNWDQAAIERHPLVLDLMRRTWDQWRAGQVAAAAIRVHTGAITVSDKKGQLSWFEVENPPPPPPPEVENYDFHADCTPADAR